MKLRRGGALAAFLAGWVAVSLACAPSESAASNRPVPELVVYVLFDTLGGEHVSHLGYDRVTTPNLDALAKNGVAFLNAVSPAPYALGSIPSLMTGRYPDRHGMVDEKARLPDSETTLAESLSSAGYRTVAFSSVYNGGPHYGGDQGFDRFEEMYRGPGPEGATRVQFQGELCHFPSPSEYLAPVRAELDRRGEGQRLFMFLHFLQPHAPYDPPAKFLELFRDERFPGPYVDESRGALAQRAARKGRSRADVEALIHLYDSNIAWADDGLGQVLDELKARGLYDEALIVATGNHGEAFWEHGMRGHGVHLHRELMHAPMVLKLPASDGKAGLKAQQLVSNMDLVPTILERVGIEYSQAHYDAKSLSPLLNNPQTTTHRSLFMRSEPKPGVQQWAAMRWEDRKMIVKIPSGESAFYYNLVLDPLEQDNLLEEQLPQALEASIELNRFRDQLLGLQARQEPGEGSR